MSNIRNRDPINIIICGVGGQGNILASELLGSALLAVGFNITVGETYGASQRGGGVMSHVRASYTRRFGVLIPRGEADIIVGFEPIETLRVAREYANKETIVLFDQRPNYPLSVLIGEETYPNVTAITEEMRIICGAVYQIEATSIAMQEGNTQGANILMLGALAALPEVPVNLINLTSILTQRFSGQVFETNRKVLDSGLDLMNSLISSE